MRRGLVVLAMAGIAVAATSVPASGQVAAPKETVQRNPGSVTLYQASKRIARYERQGSLALLRKSPYRGFRTVRVRNAGSRCARSTTSMAKRRCHTRHRVTWVRSATGARAGQSDCVRRYLVRRAASRKLTARYLSVSCDPRPKKRGKTVTRPPVDQPTAPVTPPATADPANDPVFQGLFPPSSPVASASAAGGPNAVAHAAGGRGWSYTLARPHPVPQECTQYYWDTDGFWYYACAWHQRPLPGLGVGFYQQNIDYLEFWWAYPGGQWRFWASYEEVF
jgi:hypothetical protein